MGLDKNNVLVLRRLLLPCALTTGCSFLATNFDAESAVGRDAFTRETQQTQMGHVNGPYPKSTIATVAL